MEIHTFCVDTLFTFYSTYAVCVFSKIREREQGIDHITQAGSY